MAAPIPFPRRIPFQIGMPTYILKNAVLVIGPNRSGKTTYAGIPSATSALQGGASVVISDLNCEYEDALESTASMLGIEKTVVIPDAAPPYLSSSRPFCGDEDEWSDFGDRQRLIIVSLSENIKGSVKAAETVDSLLCAASRHTGPGNQTFFFLDNLEYVASIPSLSSFVYNPDRNPNVFVMALAQPTDSFISAHNHSLEGADVKVITGGGEVPKHGLAAGLLGRWGYDFRKLHAVSKDEAVILIRDEAAPRESIAPLKFGLGSDARLAEVRTKLIKT